MALYEYEFNPVPVETEIFLSEEPMRLLLEHIKTQFKNPHKQSIDYVSTFISNWRYSIPQIESDDDKVYLQELLSEFIVSMQNIIREYTDVEFVNIDDDGPSEALDRIHMVYRYFVLNIKHNFASYCSNMIDNNKDKYINFYKEEEHLTSIRYDNDIEDKDTSILLANLYSIINDILYAPPTTIDEFIKYSDYNNPRLETEVLDELYNDYKVVGNFLEKYTKMLNNNIISDIEIKIKKRILKKYKQSLKK